jgi:hypothetical protein
MYRLQASLAVHGDPCLPIRSKGIRTYWKKVTFKFILDKWIVAKKIHRRGRREAQRRVVFLCVPLRSLLFFE